MTAAPTMTRPELIVLLATVGVLLLFLQLHLLPALLGGLLVFELIAVMVPHLRVPTVSGNGRRLLAVTLIAVVVIGSLTALGFALTAFLKGGNHNIAVLFERMAQIIEDSRDELPSWLMAYLPGDARSLRAAVVEWLREHAAGVQLAGQTLARGLGQLLIGMIIGALLSLHIAGRDLELRPLSQQVFDQASRLADAFRRVVFAQVIISAFNTLFTAIYLGLVLPAFGVELPLLKTMILITFIAGLIPILGNLVSNTVIFIVSLSHSLWIALVSLMYLVVIHNLEYFLNARVIGGRIAARAWELLLAMLVMEAAFGLAGLIAAPIYYAYLKSELSEKRLV